MSNPFDQFDSTESGAANPFDQFDAAKPTKKQNKGIAGDLVTDVKRGVEQIPGILSGLADIPIAGITGTAYANKATNALADITGFKPSQWAKDAEAEYSPGRQAAKANVDQAWEQNQSPFKDAASGDLSGIGNIAKAYIQNPQQLIGTVAESLPSMAAGGIAGRAAMGLGARGVGAAAGGVGPELPGILARTVGEKLAPVIAGSGGEGAVMAGQQMDRLSNTDADPRAAAGASLLTGIGGAAIGALGGKVAQKFGVIDLDTAMASGAMRGVTSEAGDQTIKGAIKDGAKRMAGGAVSEGLFEELPQSVLEQVLSNLAQGKPWEDGVSRAAVEGTLAGGLMGGAFNAIPPTKQEAKQDTPPVDPAQQNPLLALPAPTYTGTPGGQLVQADAERQAAIDKAQAEADAERQAAIDKAQAEADALYAARDEYERTQAGYRQQAKPTIITDPAPIQQRIDALMGINEARLQGFARTNYEKALENAFSEQIGVVAGKDSIEIPFTMGDYLKSKVAAADIERKTAAKAPPADPVIPVVGPLSAVANAAVQSGAHQATVMQQAAAIATGKTESATGKSGTPAGAQKIATAPAKGPLTEVASAVAPNIEGNPNAANPAPVAKEAPKENAPQVGAAPAKAEGASGSTGQAFISSRTDVQLSWLAEKGKGENKDLAVAELARRRSEIAAPKASSVKEVRRTNHGDGYTGIEFSFGKDGFASVIAGPDGRAYVSNVQIGEADSTERGKGSGTKAYADIGAQLARQGIVLESTRWDKHKSAISPAAIGVWEKLVAAGLAKKTGEIQGKIFDRFTSEETVGAVPTYEFVSQNQPEAAPVKSEQPQPAKGAENAQAQTEVLNKAGAVPSNAAPAPTTNQNTIKNETPAAATVHAKTTAPNQEPIKNEDDWLGALFGAAPTAAESASKEVQTNRQAQDKADRVDSAIAMLTGEIEASNAAAAEVAARNYKSNRKQIELKGDGPGKNGSLSISAINESRKRRTVEALQNASSSIKQAIEFIAENPDGAFKQVADMEAAVTKQFNEGFFGPSAKLDGQLDMAVGSLIGSGSYSGEGSAGRKLRMAAHAYASADAVSQPKTDAAPEARKGIRTIDKWTAAEIQARIDKGTLSPESEKKMRAELASRKPSVVSQEPELSAGKTPSSAEPITVRDGVVYLGKYPAADFETGEDVTVPDGASKQQIADALRKSGAIGQSKVFGLKNDAAPSPANVPAQAVTPQHVENGQAEPVDKAAEQAPAVNAKGNDSDSLSREMAGFTGVSDAEYALRQLSHKEKQEGDIELGNGKFVTLEQAVAAAKMSMDPADWIKPFQFNRILDIAPIDWNTMVGAMKNATVDAKKQEEAEPVDKAAEQSPAEVGRQSQKVKAPAKINMGGKISPNAGASEQSTEVKEPWMMTLDEILPSDAEISDDGNTGFADSKLYDYGNPDMSKLSDIGGGYSVAPVKGRDSILLLLKGEYRIGVYTGEFGIKAAYRSKGLATKLVKEAMRRGIYTPDESYSVGGAKTVEKAHKEIIREAVSEGKPVPDEVLADYPDLKNATVDAKKQEEAKPVADNEPTEAGRGPRQYNTMADIDSAIEGIYDGTVSLADYKAAFNGLLTNKEAITAELGKMTIPQLHERFGKQPYGRPEKKGEIVERAFESVRNTFSLRRDYGRNSYSMGPGQYEKYLADNLKALTDLVNASTAEDLKAFADEIGQTRAARQEKVEAAQDPKTIEDFDNALRLKKAEGMSFAEGRMSLTPEQRAEYDRLKGIATRDQRKARADQQKTDVRVASQTTGAQIVEGKHSKQGYALWSVQLADRVDGESYKTLLSTAKRMGGNYVNQMQGRMWKTVWGFQFKDQVSAEAFMKLAAGDKTEAEATIQERRDAFADDRSQSAVERLSEMAGKLEDRADESLGRERKANTERRARFAASAESAANTEKAMATTMRRIASAISDGTAQFLDRVRQKAQIEYLTATLRTAKGIELRTKYPSYADQQRHEGEPATGETADYAEFPQYAMMRSDLANLARKLVTLPNMKLLGQRILKVADDTSTVYNAFAKEHLLEVSKFGKADGSGWATFSTLKGAERSIDASNLAAVAVPLQIKRGEYRIVLSPSEAINRGIWKGDDRKIFLSPEVGEEIVEKLGRLNRKHGQRRGMDAPPEAPWQFENAYNNRKRLAGLGIEQPWEFRAALREFASLKEAPKEADKIKAMERAMIGRKNDGLDFFPTPAETARAMIDAAEITEGMSVLEPSAGMGHIAEQVRDAGVSPDVIEFNGERRELLEAKGFNVVGTDFMDADEQYDRIIMNPPFSNRRDAEHVQHAYSLLKPGGRLVAIMGEGVFFGQDKKAVAFREWLDEVGGTSEKLEEGTFLDPSLPVNTSTNARMVVVEKPEGAAAPADNEGAGNIAAKGSISPADKAIYGMAAEGKSAAEVLKFIASASRSPFNRQVARLLLKTGIAPSITVGDSKTWNIRDAKSGEAFAAAYDPKTNTVALFRPASAERNALHELIHAASLKALAKNGLASAQMKALFAHVEKTGKLTGMYGIRNVDEFIAEAFSNPKFQEALKQVSAAPVGGKPSSAWDWFIRVVRGILGLKQGQDNALSQALDIGIGVMRENMRLNEGTGDVRYNAAPGKINQTDTEAFKRWFGDSKVVDSDGKPLVVYHGTAADFAEFSDASHRSILNSQYQGDGFHFSADPGVASAYADAARNQFINKDRIFALVDDKMPPLAAKVFKAVVNDGYDAAWDLPDAEVSAILAESRDAGIDLNELLDIAEAVEGTNYHKGRKQSFDAGMIFGSSGPSGVTEWTRTDAVKLGLHDALPNQSVLPVYLSAKNILRTRNPKAAKAAKANGYDGVYYYGEGTVRGEPEYIVFDPTQIKSAIGNYGDFDGSNPDIRYNVADEGWSITEQAKETVMRLAGRPMLDPSDPFAAENARLREQDQSLWSKAKKQLRRYLAPGGLLPQSVFSEKIKRDSEFQAVEFDVRHLIGGLEHAVKADFGMAFDKLSKEQMRPITEALAGNVPASLPEATKTAAVAMRQYIDGMSTEYLKIIQQKIDAKMLKAIESGKDSDKAQAINEIELFEKIKGNIGRYVHRSYQAFDDPKWFEKVPALVLNASRLYLKQGYMEAGETDAKAAQMAEVTLHEILKNGTAYDSMESFIAESKLGAKDLSVLMRRKEVPPQIRALLGEYPDARLNFTKSATKMGRLIWNTRFLDRVRDMGMGSFFFEGKDRPPNATTQIAADGSEVYAPLNGLWTFPETAQAFKDALGKEQMSDLYRAIVRANGLVKYGKAQPLDAEIKTPTGPIVMGDVEVGTVVCGIDGPTTVTGVFPQGDMDVYRLTFCDGSSTEASDEHLWNVTIDGKERTLTTADLLSLPSYRIAKRQVSVPLGRAHFDTKDVPLDPYLMGVLLGDGSFRGSVLRLSTPEKDIVDRVRALLPEGYAMNSPASWSDIDYAITAPNKSEGRRHKIRVALEEMGLWGHLSLDKFIPVQYMRNSHEIRMEVARGLLDTDGWVDRLGQPHFTTSSRRLAEDFQELAESLGASVIWGEKESASGNIAYDLGVRVEDARKWFWLPRKAEKATPRKKPAKRTISTIEYVGMKQCQCIMVDDPRHLYLTDRFIVTHNTVLAPTTAMRNWQSAMFFSLANGHFDLTQMKKSISAFREQVSQKATGQDLKYLRHLKQLGVVYDTPYAGEMARLMEDARMEELLSSDKGDAVRWFRKANQLARGFYTFGDDFWKIIGFENEKAGLMKAGLSLQEAEIEAAKRIRDTYPTYSMVGRGVQWLSRFPLAGTFVSFPAEIIRTSGNMLRTVAADLKSDNPKLRELGMKRAAGMVFVSAAFYSLAALSMAMAGVGDDEDEAIRDLAPEWQKNSTFLYLGRDEKGNLRYFDMSFLDPYGYWKRPITAMLRNQPWEDSLSSGLRGMLVPFLGADISAKAIFEAVSNAKESGGKVYKENDGAIDQAVDIADHLRKALQPGVVGNVERLVKAAGDVRKSSGQPYSMEDELVALAGWRATTIEPKTALYYRSFEFTDSLSEARKTLTDTLRDANDVSPEDIKDARERAKSKQEQAFKEMSRLVGAAEAAGMSKMQIVQTLRLSNISQANIGSLMRGETPDVSITPQLAARAVRQASQMRGPEFAADVFDRYRQAMAK